MKIAIDFFLILEKNKIFHEIFIKFRKKKKKEICDILKHFTITSCPDPVRPGYS